MSVGKFAVKKQPPTEAEVIEALGENLPLWNMARDEIGKTYAVQVDFKFMYGKNYGWAVRYRIKTQFLVNLYPGDGLFTVQVNLPPEAVEQAMGMDLEESVLEAIQRATPYPEGRWVFIPVRTEKEWGEVSCLLDLRVKAKKLHKGT